MSVWSRTRFINIAYPRIGPGPARYCMPGLTGRSGHDVTKKIQPAYTFGKRLGISCEGH